MKIAFACVTALIALSFGLDADAARKVRWVCIGDSLTHQPGFADAVCEAKLGITGATSGTFAHSPLLDLPPGDRAVVLLGTNDARLRIPATVYRENMQTVVRRLREHYKKIILVEPPKTNSVVDSVFFRVYRPMLAAICKSKKRVRCVAPALLPSVHLEDGIHPNAAGHSLIAVEVHRAQRRKR